MWRSKAHCSILLFLNRAGFINQWAVQYFVYTLSLSLSLCLSPGRPPVLCTEPNYGLTTGFSAGNFLFSPKGPGQQRRQSRKQTNFLSYSLPLLDFVFLHVWIGFINLKFLQYIWSWSSRNTSVQNQTVQCYACFSSTTRI